NWLDNNSGGMHDVSNVYGDGSVSARAEFRKHQIATAHNPQLITIMTKIMPFSSRMILNRPINAIQFQVRVCFPKQFTDTCSVPVDRVLLKCPPEVAKYCKADHSQQPRTQWNRKQGQHD